MRATLKLQDFVAARPSIDWIVPILAIGVWVYFFCGSVPVMSGDVFYAVLSAAAGIALAAATFACTFMYRSPSPAIRHALGKFGKAIGRNWFSILVSLLLATLSPILAVALENTAPQVAFGLGLLSAGIIIVKFARVAFWVRYTLTVEYHGNKVYERREMKYKGLASRKDEK